MLRLIHTCALDVSGIFTFATLTNPSPFPHMESSSCFLMHPPDASCRFHSSVDLGSYPGRHVHSKSCPLFGSQ
ncbi:hypothetical protein RHMOL_Rhmol11G0143200 [Rhododendron molle]|uniref:Uncharacterized protein n=1 Tax=Rhododendron molle TaxID=49168 RepID=A0ACC0LT21_RHOML|nr:hypothetical protein RHMOL_Rhmol11G0143200 [Rhododendron molle]